MRTFLTLFDTRDSIATELASLSFALLPFWPFGGGTVALMPLVLWAFFSLEKRINFLPSVAVMILVPFYSSFYLASMYTCMFLYLYLLFSFAKSRKLTKSWAILSLHVLIYLGLDYRIFLHVINKTFVSQRVEMNSLAKGTSFSDALETFLNGHYHSFPLHKYVILPSTILLLLYWFGTKKGSFYLVKNIFLLVALLFGLTVFSEFWKMPISDLLREWVPMVKMVKLQRIYFLFPFLWAFVFFFTLKYFQETLGNKIVWLLSGLQLFVLFYNSDYLRNYFSERVSFKDFYAHQEISKLVKDIKSMETVSRFMAIGIHPAVLTYNNLKTLDFYIPHYPMAYKSLFLKFLGKELELDPKTEKYVKEQGIRLYFYSHEIGRFGSGKSVKCPEAGISIPQFDYKLIIEHGGRFFISACPVKTWIPVAQTASEAYKHLYLYDITRLRGP
jgi:hypothetical protein